MKRAVLSLLCLGGCGAPTGPQVGPWVRLEPPNAIMIEPTAADTVASAAIEVVNEGDRPLRLETVSISSPRADAWQVMTAIALGEAIAPGSRTQVFVEYRPCPLLLAGGALCDCEAHRDTATLSIKTNADAQATQLTLSASAVAPGPRIGLEPLVELALGRATTGTIRVRNAGCGVLQLRSADLSGPGGGPSASVDDFKIAGCQGWPCPLDLTICEQGCGQTQAVLHLNYDNDDLVGNEITELRLQSNDPWVPERILLVSAQGEPGCLPPLALVETSTHPCILAPVILDAGLSEPSGPEAAITGYRWSVAFAPEPIPALIVSEDGRTAHFIPQVAGLYLVRLQLSTECGPSETTIAQVIVADTGCR